MAVLKWNSSDREILLSLQTLMDWNLVRPDFPNIKLDTYIQKMINKHMGKKAYSALYLQQTSQVKFQQNTKVKSQQNNHIKVRERGEDVTLTKQSLECQQLQTKLMGKFKECFTEKLSPQDRIKCPDVRIILDPSKNVTPKAHTRPYDTPYHLREAFDKELKEALDAGILSPSTEPSEWVHQLFPVAKPGQPGKVRLVADFRRLNSCLSRPVYPTESVTQLLRHIDPEATVFAVMDMCSGYHQVRVHPEDREYLTVICQAGRFRYNCLSQGITSASDLFNMVSDGNSRFGELWKCSLKNMDDVLICGVGMEDLKEKMHTFLDFCKTKNIKLKPSKFRIATEVEFGGCIISRETLEESVFIEPKNNRILALEELRKPESKRDLQVFAGMVASLQNWFPSLPLVIPNIRRACGGKVRLEWDAVME